ncbi:uncharacterized protein LOC135290230 [Passer domesticus]|uniref:uncharacterized protein LOC135290230 n=1 Tax=Passer domesticus TaxID=48849 RepID=UPI0030FE4959
MYINAQSVGNKQEELEAIAQQENYDTVTITGTWWGNSHDWSAAMGGYLLFRRGPDCSLESIGELTLWKPDCGSTFLHLEKEIESVSTMLTGTTI